MKSIKSHSILLFVLLFLLDGHLHAQLWTALGSGMNSQVCSLAIYNGELYAGGDFFTAGGTSALYIAKWNGSSWMPVGSGTNNRVRALIVYNGELYAGGSYTTAGGISASYIAKWSGSIWSTVGSGTN